MGGVLCSPRIPCSPSVLENLTSIQFPRIPKISPEFLRVYVYIFHIGIYVNMYTCAHRCTYVHICIYVLCICVHIHMYLCTYVHLHMYMFRSYVQMYICTCLHMYIRTYAYMHLDMHIFAYVHMCIYTCPNMYICTGIHMYIWKYVRM